MVHLQGIGDVHTTKRAGDLQPGDVILWNFGETSTVMCIVKETAKTVTVRTSVPSGNWYERRYNKTRELAIQNRGNFNG